MKEIQARNQHNSQVNVREIVYGILQGSDHERVFYLTFS